VDSPVTYPTSFDPERYLETRVVFLSYLEEDIAMFNKKNRVWQIALGVIVLLAVMAGTALAASQTFYAPQRGVNVRTGPVVSSTTYVETLSCGTEVAVDDSTLIEAGGHDWMQMTDGSGRWVAVDVMAKEMPACLNTAAASTPQKFAAVGTATDTTTLSRTWSDWGVEVEGLNPATMAKLGVVTVSSTVTFTVKVNEAVWFQAATPAGGETPLRVSLKAGERYTLVAYAGNNVFWKSAISEANTPTTTYCNGGLATPNGWGNGHCYSSKVSLWAVGNEIGEFDVPFGTTGADLVIQVQLESANCSGNGMDADGGVLYGVNAAGKEVSANVVLPDAVQEFTLVAGIHYSIGMLGGCSAP